MSRPVLDVSHLPSFAFGRRDLLFWGVVLLICIETTVFGLVGFSYFYSRNQLDVWPPTLPDAVQLQMGAGVVLTLLASVAPTYAVTRAAKRASLKDMRRSLLLATLLGAGTLVFRALEFRYMPFRWDTNVYGSLFWGALTLHTLHLLTGVGEDLLFLVLLYRGPVEQKHLVDLEVNSLYWYFVVAVWLPLFLILYFDGVLRR